MAGTSALVRLGKTEVWAYVVETGEGLRVRESADEWAALGLHAGQRLPVRRPGRADEPMFLAEAIEVPPFVWLVMLSRTALTPTWPERG